MAISCILNDIRLRDFAMGASYMDCTVFAQRFRLGKWQNFEHDCTKDELDAVIDSAQAIAEDHNRMGVPAYVDYLRGIRYVFDVARGTRARPAEGDVRVFGACVDGLLVGEYEEIKRHFKAA